jgi:hypothetical protein
MDAKSFRMAETQGENGSRCPGEETGKPCCVFLLASLQVPALVTVPSFLIPMEMLLS